jgi:hypothetical protein
MVNGQRSMVKDVDVDADEIGAVVWLIDLS